MIKLLSDLHVEFQCKLTKMDYFPYAGEDILVLAGDINSHSDACIDTVQKFHDEGYPDIIYVAGNHEYYSYERQDVFNAKMRRFSEENSTWFHFLDKDWYCCDKTKSVFIGATLWSNFGNNPLSEYAASQGIGDFYHIPGFTTHDCKIRYERDIVFIKQAITVLKDMFPEHKMYVVTHFLPAKVCVDPRYKENRNGLNDYFANDLDNYLFDEVPDGLTWIFGHTHTPIDIQHGNTRLVCNPYGYQGYESQHNFKNKCYV